MRDKLLLWYLRWKYFWSSPYDPDLPDWYWRWTVKQAKANLKEKS